MQNNPWYISTDNGLNLSGAIADIDNQIEALQEKKHRIKALKKEIKRITEEHIEASWGKGKYHQKYDEPHTGLNQAYEQLRRDTNELRDKLEEVGFKVDVFTSWDCVEVK